MVKIRITSVQMAPVYFWNATFLYYISQTQTVKLKQIPLFLEIFITSYTVFIGIHCITYQCHHWTSCDWL